ncbi:hypothetical protein [Halorussus lipolyticus]|uniref:hypothetical protein n=1 Tax=Halorussus lipolyticus TaxID=3034024 RepID=UPI0023E8B7D8|nr:hypothetical protein [Halorussus sp. DT80]
MAEEAETTGPPVASGVAGATEDPDPNAFHRVCDDSLVVWALASFHTAGLVALLVVALYLAGPLGDLLSGLDTVVGLALYLGLWAATWWTNRRAFRAIADAGDDAESVSASVVVGTGGKWAGVDGVLFLWMLLLAAVFPPSSVTLAGVAYFLAFGGIASLLAFVVGAIVGSLFALLDLALFRAAGGLVPKLTRRKHEAGESDDTA